MDVPRSPWRRPPAQSRYRMRRGDRARVPGAARQAYSRRCAGHDGGRVPGSTSRMRNIATDTANERYRERREPACDEAKQAITPQRSIDPVRLGHVVRVSVAVLEAHARAETRRFRPIHDLEPPARSQQVRQLGNERRAIARMRRDSTLPCGPADDEPRLREQQPWRLPFLERREQSARMIEVQMTSTRTSTSSCRMPRSASDRSSTCSCSSTPNRALSFAF